MNRKVMSLIVVGMVLASLGMCLMPIQKLAFNAPALRDLSKADWNGSMLEVFLNFTYDLGEAAGYLGEIIMANIGGLFMLGLGLLFVGLVIGIGAVGIGYAVSGVHKAGRGRK